MYRNFQESSESRTKTEDESNGAKSVVDSSIPIDQRDSSGRTQLSHAASNGPKVLVEKLLDAGAHVNSRDCKRRTPLHHAAAVCHSDITSLLLKRGADVNRQTKSHMTPLMVAFRSHNSINLKMDILKVLITKEFNMVEPRDRYGRTHLHWAIKGGNVEIVKFVMNHGGHALVKITDNFKKTCLFEASRYNKAPVIEYLLTFTKENMHNQLVIPDRKLWLPLHYAAKHGHLQSVICILCEAKTHCESSLIGANHKIAKGLTPLMAAASTCQIQVMRYLLDCEYIDVDDVDDFGSNALMHVIVEAFRYQRNIRRAKTKKPWLDAAFMLLQANTNVNCHTNYTIFWPSKSYHSQNALEVATKSGLGDIVKLLVFAGSDLGNLEINDIKPNEKYLQKNEDLVEWLRNFYGKPRSLKDLSRISFKRYIGNKLKTMLNIMQLPTPIKEYLCLKDIENVFDVISVDIQDGEKSTEAGENSEYEYEPSVHDSDENTDDVASIVDSS